jgi:hypothetical protein
MTAITSHGVVGNIDIIIIDIFVVVVVVVIAP